LNISFHIVTLFYISYLIPTQTLYWKPLQITW